MKNLFISILISIFLLGCSNQEEMIQKALSTSFAGTEMAKPTKTNTLEQTDTQEPTITETNTPTPEDTSTPIPTNTPRSTNTPKPSATPKESEMHKLKLGEEYYANGYFLKVMEFEDPLKEYNKRRNEDIPDGYKVVSILVIIGNESGDPEKIYTRNYTLVDREGFVYQSYIYSIRLDNLDFENTDNLLQGEKIMGWINFFIPEESKPSYIKYEMNNDYWLYAGLSTEE